MSNVALTVGGRRYTVSCADGQEEHVQRLAGMVDAKLAGMGTNLTANEAKNLLFAAIMLADEVEDSRASQATEDAKLDGSRLASQLERLAGALEDAASALESGSATH